jgi:hydrogenase nickel incorporation protein HypB
MCTTCGCSKGARTVYTDPQTGERSGYQPLPKEAHAAGVAAYLHARAHRHSHGDEAHEHEHAHEVVHEPPRTPDAKLSAAAHGTTIALEESILAKNQLLAERNRAWFTDHRIVALNLVSSPGAGKTTLLERTILDLQDTLPIHVIEGDQATLNDAKRISATGCRVVQINTGTGCHLDAGMIWTALQRLDVPRDSRVMIENVGNLVCPALFDLGERMKVVVLSVTEGEDKPLKYPHMFRASNLMLLNKIDLLPHLHFDVEQCIAYARQVNPAIEVMQVSAQTGQGMYAWYDWLREVEPIELLG